MIILPSLFINCTEISSGLLSAVCCAALHLFPIPHQNRHLTSAKRPSRGRAVFRGTMKAAVFALAFALLPLLLPHMTAHAYDCGSLTCTWDGTAVTISGQGEIPKYAFNNNQTVTEVIIEEGVTSVGSSAFGDCYSLRSVKIPGSVTSIGEEAFAYCHSLANVTFNGTSELLSIGESAFSGENNLQSIEIPATVTSIGPGAFQECDFRSVEIPASVTSIGSKAFWVNYDLADVTIVRSNTDALQFGSDVFLYSGSKCTDQHYVTKVMLSYTGDAAAVWELENGSGFTITEENGQPRMKYVFETHTESGTLKVKLSPQTPEFSPASGTNFDDRLEVTISCSTADADIYYTTDGTDPSGSSTKYTGPFTITDSATVKAIAVKDGIGASETASAQYTKNQYTITVNANNDSYGTVSGGGTFEYGESATVKASPNGGYIFVNWTENGKEAGTEPEYTFTVEKDRTLTANFKEAQGDVYTVTVTVEGKGSASASPVSGVEGTKVTLSAKPAEGYTFSNWQVISGGVTIKNDAFTIKNADVEIKAVFREKPADVYTVTVTTDGNGTATADPKSGTEGTEVTLSASPNEGYTFSEWQVVSGGVTVENDKFTIGTEDVEIKAVFEKIPEEGMTVDVTFVYLKDNGKRGVPSEMGTVVAEPVISIKKGKKTVTSSEKFSLDFTGAEKKRTIPVEFPKNLTDLANGGYTVAVKGIPEKLLPEDYIEEPEANMRTYKITVKAEINVKKNQPYITVYLIFSDQTVEKPREPEVYPLPEDEIGAYAIREDGTKEYLLFHTYDICMAWLGSEDLCSGPERCYHKDGK